MALKGLYTSERVGGGGGLYINAISYGGLQPEVQPLTFLHTIFGIKDTPLVFLLLKTGTPVTYYFGRVFWSWLVCQSC